jgi:hypothetical protein
VLGEPGREAVKRALLANVEADWDTGCWVWTGKVQGGYGRFRSRATGEWLPHRMTWHIFHPGHAIGQELDHRHGGSYGGGALCVNPLHLQPVTPKRNKELRDLRRADPLGYWYREGETGSVPLPLLVFARLNGLPLKTPELDYSAQWEPGRERPAESEPLAPVVPEQPAPVVPLAPSGPPEVERDGLRMSERIFRELKLSPLEAAVLRTWFSHPVGGRQHLRGWGQGVLWCPGERPAAV